MKARSSEPLIAVDWGSTNLRAKLVIDGLIVDQAESADGIRNCRGRDFDEILESLCGSWRQAHPDVRVIMSGMIGSREGWREVPYVDAPAGIDELAAGLVSISSRNFSDISILPGVRFDDPGSGATDVMRGEETQVVGLLNSLPADEAATICIPGTHSKWIVCRDGKIERFRSWLTGEAFDRLTQDSLISGSGGEVVPVSAAFSRGLDFSETDGGLLHHLFLGRTEMLMGRVAPDELRSFLSGLLIGHEIRDASTFAEGPVFLIGDSPAAEATAASLRHMGTAATRVTSDVHLAGILAITDA